MFIGVFPKNNLLLFVTGVTLSLLGVTPKKGGIIVAIPDDKKRVFFSLTYDDIDKLKYLYSKDKKHSDSRIYESDTLSKVINEAYASEKEVKNEKRS